MTWNEIWNNYINLEPGILQIALRLACAMVVGLVIGLEREFTHRPAGLRTHILVALGACVASVLGEMIFCNMNGNADPARISAQVITGVGFLGAGTIIVTRRNQIKGLTTAAGLWAAAGVGLALGIGFYEAALFGGFAIFTVMTLLQKMDNRMHRKTKTIEVYMEVTADLTLGELLRIFREAEYEVQDVQRESSLENDAAGNRAYIAILKAKTRRNHAEVLEAVRQLPGLVYVEEL